MAGAVNLSFGSQTGRTRSGTKGFSSKEKKLKRKKQEFHSRRRAHDQQTMRPDAEEVRARTILALDRLGHQVISTEPGGYDLEDWVRSLDSLLDDFQEKVGADRITEEFRARRREAVSYLVGQSRSAVIDSEVQRLARDEEEARRAFEEAQGKAAERLASLRGEREEREKELKAEKQRLAEMMEAKRSRNRFSRILRAAPSTEQAEASVARLESELRRIEEEIEGSRKPPSTADGRGNDELGKELLDARQRLEAIQARMVDLQSARQSSLQLAREREIATQSISGVISSMKLEGS